MITPLLTASLPAIERPTITLPPTKRPVPVYPHADTDGRRTFRQNLNGSTNFTESERDAVFTH